MHIERAFLEIQIVGHYGDIYRFVYAYRLALDVGRYFVHVSPNKKTMLIRKHEEGEIFCVNHQIMIQDLERLYPFSEVKELKAEISSKYGGILVHLDI